MNKFIDGIETSLWVTMRIPVDVKSFGGIGVVANALSLVDTVRRDTSESPTTRQSRRASYQLKSFRVESPPQVQILSDPAWLGVFIALGAFGVQVIASYPQLKSGFREIKGDLSGLKDNISERKHWMVSQSFWIADRISGLSSDTRMRLQMGIELYIEDLFNLPDEAFTRLAQRAQRFSRSLGLARHGDDLNLNIEIEGSENRDR